MNGDQAGGASFGLGGYVVAGYAESLELLTSRKFSRAMAAEQLGERAPATESSTVEMDYSARHTRIRELVAGYIGPQRVERLRRSVEAIAADMTSDVLRSGPPVELLGQFCEPFAFAVQCEMLGVPEHRRAALCAASKARSPHRPDAPRAAARAHAASELNGTMGELVCELRHTPGPGLLHWLIAACDAGAIDHGEALGIASSLCRDGPFHVALQIANSVLYMLDHPELATLLRERTTLIDRAVDELLRLCPAINHTMPRIALVETNLRGVTVPAGATVTACVPAANRDGRAFSNPAALELERRATRHLSFGRGIHYCLGSSLARMEIGAALRTLIERAPRLRLATQRSELRPFTTQGAIGVRELPVTW